MDPSVSGEGTSAPTSSLRQTSHSTGLMKRTFHLLPMTMTTRSIGALRSTRRRCGRGGLDWIFDCIGLEIGIVVDELRDVRAREFIRLLQLRVRRKELGERGEIGQIIHDTDDKAHVVAKEPRVIVVIPGAWEGDRLVRKRRTTSIASDARLKTRRIEFRFPDLVGDMQADHLPVIRRVRNVSHPSCAACEEPS